MKSRSWRTIRKVGVGMTITNHPLHRSGRAELPHPAPTLGHDAHARQRIGMADDSRRKPSGEQPIHTIPRQPFPFTTTPQRVVPVVANLKPEPENSAAVAGHSVVADETTNHRAKPLSLFGNRRMHALPQLGLNLLKLATQPLSYRLADDRVHAVTSFLPANMREAQEVECLRPPLISPVAVFDRKWTEFQKPRFLGVQRQTELSESLLQFGQTPFRFGPALESDHEVIRPSDDNHIVLSFGTSPVMNPQIQDVMKKDIRQGGEMTPPCGVPSSTASHFPCSIAPAFSHFWMSRMTRGSPIRCSTN